MLIKTAHATVSSPSMARGSLIKAALQTASEHLIKFLHKLMRHNVYTSMRRLVKLPRPCASDTAVWFQRGSESESLIVLPLNDMQIVKANVPL